MFPLHNISYLLRVLNIFGGFPIRIDNSELRTKKVVEYLKFLPTITALIMFGCASYVVLIVDLHGKLDLQLFKEVTGLSFLDVGALSISTFASMIASFRIFLAFIRQRKDIELLCKRLDSVCAGANGMGLQAGLNSKKKIVSITKYLFAFVWLGAAFLTATSYLTHRALIPDGGNLPLKWVYFLSSFFSVFFGLFSPAIAAGFIVSTYLINYLSGCMWRFRDNIKSSTAYYPVEQSKGELFIVSLSCLAEGSDLGQHMKDKENQRRCTRIKALLADGIELCRIGERLNECLAPFVLTHFALALTAGTTTTYLDTNVLFGSITSLTLTLCLGFFFIGFTYLFALYHLCSAGQDLEDARRKTKDAIAQEVSSVAEFADHDLLFSFKMLQEKLIHDHPVAPFHYFGVNHAGFMHAMGAVFTYIIVLLQFKVT